MSAPLSPPETLPATTLVATLVPGGPGRGGYHRLQQGPGEAHRTRTDLGGARPATGLRPLLAFVQLSDLHVVDAQSPGRAEFLDRLGDPDSPVAATIGPVGGYRPQESLSFHVVEAMAQAIGRLQTGPVTGLPLSFVISTGDNVDNGQRNEIDAYISLLDGAAEVRPDSGSYRSWEGVGSPEFYDVRYWHPDGTPAGEADDLPRGLRGFPEVPDLLEACRLPIRATGVGLPWYEVHGNHDQLLGGTLPASPGLIRLAKGGRKPVSLNGFDPAGLQQLLGDHERQPPDLLGGLGEAVFRQVTPDPGRAAAGTAGWLDGHTRRGLLPARPRPWYAFDAGRFRCLVLDTVNPHGGWQGSIDAEQWTWLEHELEAGSSRWTDADGRAHVVERPDRTFLIFSHHPLSTLVNDWSPDGGRRMLAAEMAALISRFPNVAVWFNGHTHTHRVQSHGPTESPDAHAHTGHHGTAWWEVTTASHADWPQQGRVVELAEEPATGDLVIISTVVDHAGLLDARRAALDDPLSLAGWSRELAVNHWQRPRTPSGEPLGRGDPDDRNVVLVLPAR